MKTPSLSIAKEGWPFILPAAAIGIFLLPFTGFGSAFFWIFTAYFIYFFRDPDRVSTADPLSIAAGADGIIAAIKEVSEGDITGLEEIRKATGKKDLFRNGALRVSIFLSLFDVHVNRAPIAGRITFLKYYPGKRYFTFTEKSSRYNQHNAIVINGSTDCLVHQIVGPVARRVVAWLRLGQTVSLGQKIGIMKFGSRMDMYFRTPDITLKIKCGDRVRAGESIIGLLNKESDEWRGG